MKYDTGLSVVSVSSDDRDGLYKFAFGRTFEKQAADSAPPPPPAASDGKDYTSLGGALLGALIGGGVGYVNHLVTPQDKDEKKRNKWRALKHILGGAALGSLAGYGIDYFNVPKKAKGLVDSIVAPKDTSKPKGSRVPLYANGVDKFFDQDNRSASTASGAALGLALGPAVNSGVKAVRNIPSNRPILTTGGDNLNPLTPRSSRSAQLGILAGDFAENGNLAKTAPVIKTLSEINLGDIKIKPGMTPDQIERANRVLERLEHENIISAPASKNPTEAQVKAYVDLTSPRAERPKVTKSNGRTIRTWKNGYNEYIDPSGNVTVVSPELAPPTRTLSSTEQANAALLGRKADINAGKKAIRTAKAVNDRAARQAGAKGGFWRKSAPSWIGALVTGALAYSTSAPAEQPVNPQD